MKTKYEIIESHSRTTDGEIRKAKRLFLEGVKKGIHVNPGNVRIVFYDSNYLIVAFFYCNDSGENLNSVEIKNYRL
jgi:hypothetical protein